MFLVKLLLFSLVLIPVLLAFITSGQIPTLQAMSTLPYVGSKNLYTFFILILATPGLSIKKRIIGIVAAIALFLLIDLLMTFVWLPYFQNPEPSRTNEIVWYAWYISVRYILPFLLWFVFAFKQIEGLFRAAQPLEKNPDKLP
jgi:hypothetical protein